MKKEFLLYLIYITLIEIRERSLETNDKMTFLLCDLLHNIPLHIKSDKNINEAYKDLKEKVEEKGLQNWFKTRKDEFLSRNPGNTEMLQ